MKNGRRNGSIEVTRALKERAVITALRLPAQRRWEVEESLDELGGLAMAAGATVVHRVVQERGAPTPALFLGSGKVDEIAEAGRATGANLMICDDPLTPVQERNLTQALGLKVIDRTALILDIFAQRARTAEGKLQVELAHVSTPASGRAVDSPRASRRRHRHPRTRRDSARIRSPRDPAPRHADPS